jgi:hypothetical protein
MVALSGQPTSYFSKSRTYPRPRHVLHGGYDAPDPKHTRQGTTGGPVLV